MTHERECQRCGASYDDRVGGCGRCGLGAPSLARVVWAQWAGEALAPLLAPDRQTQAIRVALHSPFRLRPRNWMNR